MTKKLISQIDHRWHTYSRYETDAADSLAYLDKELFRLLDNPTNIRRKKALQVLAEFTQHAETLIKRGEVLHGRGTYNMYNYGCWDCCMCMVAADFNQLIYPKGKGHGISPTPIHFLNVLRSWQLLSVVGYSDDIVIDVLTVLTRAKVQLYMHEDYGKAGVRLVDSPLLQFALQYRKSITLVACVKDHAIFGKKPATHWVVIDPLGSTLRDGLMMRDPAKFSIKRFSYSKLYTLCLYTTPSLARTLLAQPGSSI